MRIGRLRHRIEIGQYLQGTDDYGDPLPNQWQALTVWADVEGLQGSHYFQAQQTVDQSDHRIIIRFRKGIEQGMIVKHDGREFTIQSVLDKDGTRRWLELVCKEVNP